MNVKFRIPDHVWAQIVDIADERGTTVAHLMSAATGSLTQPGSGRQIRAIARRTRIIELVKAGYSDSTVAAVTGELKSYVGDVRRKNNLPANRRYQRKEAA